MTFWRPVSKLVPSGYSKPPPVQPEKAAVPRRSWVRHVLGLPPVDPKPVQAPAASPPPAPPVKAASPPPVPPVTVEAPSGLAVPCTPPVPSPPPIPPPAHLRVPLSSPTELPEHTPGRTPVPTSPYVSPEVEGTTAKSSGHPVLSPTSVAPDGNGHSVHPEELSATSEA